MDLVNSKQFIIFMPLYKEEITFINFENITLKFR